MRIRSLLAGLNSSIGGGALLIAFFSIVSKIVGLYRDRLLAATFGASRVTDIYFAAFKIPDLIFNILVLGALTSSFIPVFLKVWHLDAKRGIALSNSVLNLLLAFVFILAICLFFLAPVLTPYIVPGFSVEDTTTTVAMTRIILLSLVFFTVSNVLSGVLNAWNKFFTFALSSVVYNIGIIFGIMFFYPVAGIYGIAYGVVLGSVLHLIVQLIEALRNGWFYRPFFVFDSAVRRIFKLMLPRTVGLAANQINILILTILASTLNDGHLAIFNYANNLQSFPVGIFGVSLAVAAFPAFSKTLSSNDMPSFKRIFATQFKRIIYFLIPLSFTILLLRAQIVRVVLGSGSFDWEATRLTAQVLGYFALSICAQGLTPLLTRSFYAAEDTRTPVLISFIDIGLTIFLSLVLINSFGVIGLALADSIAAIVSMIFLFGALHRRFGDLNDRDLIHSLIRIIVLSAIASALMYLCLQITAQLLDTRTFAGIFTQAAVSGTVGLGAYVLLSVLLDFPEIKVVRNYLLKILRPLRNALRS